MYKAIQWCFGSTQSPQCKRVLEQPIPADTPILYSHWKSSCPWRVRITLNCKNVVYDMAYVELKRENGEQHREEFALMNPMRQIPIIIIDNQAFIESMTMLNYLEETRPYPSLMPDDPIQRARVREICELIAYGTQPLVNLAVLQFLRREERQAWIRHWITRSFTVIEQLLEKTSVRFCVGHYITLADVCLVPQLHVARKRYIDLRPYPNMLRVDRNLTMIPDFIMAHADNQRDKPRAEF